MVEITRPVIERSAGIQRPAIKKPVRVPPGMIAPNFETLFEPDDDDGIPPPYGDDVEAAVEVEMSDTLRLLLEAKKRQRDLYRISNDDEFWVAVCFQSREQKESFLAALKLADLGDKYIDGLQVAQRLGVAIEPIPLPKPKATRIQKEGGNR